MSIERQHVNQRMSQIVVHGGVVYLAGQVALDKPGTSVTEQTRETLRRIDMLLAEAGSDKSRLLTATVWLTDIATFDEMNKVWDAWVSPGNPPARACVEAKLAGPKDAFNVEIMVTASRA
jgi:enamine deaminase RidA (YjgF/YER057c/UK114 family)